MVSYGIFHNFIHENGGKNLRISLQFNVDKSSGFELHYFISTIVKRDLIKYIISTILK